MVSGSLALLSFLLDFHGGRQVGKSRRMGIFSVCWSVGPSVCLSVHPSVHLPIQPCLKPEAWLAGPQIWLAGWASDLASWASGLAAWASGLAGWPRGEGMYVHTDGHRENLPILQDFVPYRGCCPKMSKWSKMT